MKIIEIPKPEKPVKIAFDKSAEAKDVDFLEFVRILVRNHEQFGKGLENIRRGCKIIDATEKANGVLTLDDEHVRCLKDAANGIQWGQPIGELFSRAGYFDALEQAKDA